MFVARTLKQKNIAEYLLYMWQVEDLIRASEWDMEQISQKVVARYSATPEQETELMQWYSDLLEMMRAEKVVQKGHLQICRNVIIQLTDLHLRLLRAPQYPFYSAAYYKALPFIVELRAKKQGSSEEIPELETCFEALYGLVLLRMQKKEIGAETLRAASVISAFLSMLSDYYHKEKDGKLEWNDK